MIGIGIYVKNSPRAVDLYTRAFGLALGYHVLNADGTYYHSELLKDGSPFCSVVEAKQNTWTDRNPVQLGCSFPERDELEQAFTILKKDGRVEMEICELPWSPCAAIVTDCFGVNWYLTMPQHRPAEEWNPENADKNAFDKR